MSLPDFSSPSPVDGYYDVFLSFRGKDTRKGFTTNLYHALCQHEIHTFMDEELMGEEIEHLFRVIAKSRMAVVIYSKEFASSHWCLQELEMILQRKKELKMLLTPIFYKVNHDEVKHITGQTAEYLDRHVSKHGETKVEIWKVVVTNLGKVSGLSYKDNDSRSEYDFIKHVIDKVKKKLIRECQQHSVADQSSMGTKQPPIKTQWASSSSRGQLKGLVADKQRFTYGEILKITNNLDKLIARSGHGDVYSGRLNGATVVVKIAPRFLAQKLLVLGSDFLETAFTQRLSFGHENVVSLVGYCFDDVNVALVYEFMENGNLRKHLSGASPKVLTWNERLKIAINVAEGLKALHGVPLYTDGNLQSTDILFDDKMTAKILYFPCMRKAESSSTSPYDRYINKLYVDGASFMNNNNPFVQAQFGKKLDLHCFAMILYELITGHAPHLTTWENFVNELSQGNLRVDSRLVGSFNKLTVDAVIQLASYCAQMQQLDAPRITDILELLKYQSRLIEPKRVMDPMEILQYITKKY